MRKVTAKFYVRSVTAMAGSTPDTGSIELQPVSRGAANAAWSAATPSGQITMTITNPAAWRQFRDALGRELYVDFTLVPDEALDPTQHAWVEAPSVVEGTYGYGFCTECGQNREAHVA